MLTRTSRSAWAGAAIALGVSLIVLVAAGGRSPKESLPVSPVPSQAPTPTLDSVAMESNAPQATPSQPKESQ